MRDDDPSFFPARWLFPPEVESILAGIALTVPELPIGTMPVGPLALAGAIAGGGREQRVEVRGHHVVVVTDGAMATTPRIADPRHHHPDARPELAREAEWFARHHRAWRGWHPATPSPIEHDPFPSPPLERMRGPLRAGPTAPSKPPGWPASPPLVPAVVEPARRLVSPSEFARADRERDRLADAVITDVETMIRRGDRSRALSALRKGVRELPSARLFERITELERALCRGTTGTIQWKGEAYAVVLREATRIGRADAEIAIASPWLSRNHLLIRRGRDGPELVDVGSAHGTWLDGARLSGPLRVDAPRQVHLGRVPLLVEPWGDHVLVSSDNLARTIVSCGPLLSLGKWSIRAVHDDTSAFWRLEAPLDRPLDLNGIRCTAVDLLRGDRVSVADGELVVID